MTEMKDFLIDKIEEIAFQRVEADDSLWESGVLDSITIVELAVEIETEFNIEVPFDEIVESNFETVSRIMSYIERKK
ncbi:MAG: acyl carrier protein [Bacteroidetes bacterium]|nr:MAG: acyl carrier protein [Bacteroidota bacterium]